MGCLPKKKAPAKVETSVEAVVKTSSSSGKKKKSSSSKTKSITKSSSSAANLPAFGTSESITSSESKKKKAGTAYDMVEIHVGTDSASQKGGVKAREGSLSSHSTSASSKSNKSPSSRSTGSSHTSSSSYQRVPPTPHSPNTYYSYYEYYTEREAFTAAAPTSHKSQALLHLHRYPLPAQTDQVQWRNGTTFAPFIQPESRKGAVDPCANFINERVKPDKGDCRKKKGECTPRRFSLSSDDKVLFDEVNVTEVVIENSEGEHELVHVEQEILVVQEMTSSSSIVAPEVIVGDAQIVSEGSVFDDRMYYPYGDYRAVLRPGDEVDYRMKRKIMERAMREGTLDRDLLPDMDFPNGLQQVPSPYGIANDLHEYFLVQNPHENAPQNPEPTPHQQIYTSNMRMVTGRGHNEENKEAQRLLEITTIAAV